MPTRLGIAEGQAQRLAMVFYDTTLALIEWVKSNQPISNPTQSLLNCGSATNPPGNFFQSHQE